MVKYHVVEYNSEVKPCHYESISDCPISPNHHGENFLETMVLLNNDGARSKLRNKNLVPSINENIIKSRKLMSREINTIKNSHFPSRGDRDSAKFAAYSIISMSDNETLTAMINSNDFQANLAALVRIHDHQVLLDYIKKHHDSDVYRELLSKIIFMNDCYNHELGSKILKLYPSDEYVKAMVVHRNAEIALEKYHIEQYFHALNEANDNLKNGPTMEWLRGKLEMDGFESPIEKRQELLNNKSIINTEKITPFNELNKNMIINIKRNLSVLKNLESMKNDSTYMSLINAKFILKSQKNEFGDLKAILIYFLDQNDNKINLDRYKNIISSTLFREFISSDVNYNLKIGDGGRSIAIYFNE